MVLIKPLSAVAAGRVQNGEIFGFIDVFEASYNNSVSEPCHFLPNNLDHRPLDSGQLRVT